MKQTINNITVETGKMKIIRRHNVVSVRQKIYILGREFVIFAHCYRHNFWSCNVMELGNNLQCILSCTSLAPHFHSKIDWFSDYTNDKDFRYDTTYLSSQYYCSDCVKKLRSIFPQFLFNIMRVFIPYVGV